MKIHNAHDLETAIAELEKRKVVQEQLLSSQYHATVESLKPSNLIKNAFSKITSTPTLRAGIIKTVAAAGIGLLTRKIMAGKYAAIGKKLLGNAVDLAAPHTAIGNKEKLKAYGTAIFNSLFKKKHKHMAL